MAGQISESEQIKQFKEFLGTYNKLTENCFLDCIKDFTSREVKPEESIWLLPLLGTGHWSRWTTGLIWYGNTYGPI
ncbi:PREDICTED: mitochondrial import inner membrane translocase subunit Tim9 isoform X5 [Calidris pugnax]|uniref:mitochondrial import inner membrane translocase subunit Tim9 isoform X5 n=1 Tax=Calidris pugnax TaxID=198806 RepID=UPI00071C26DB|nr:PREDICTED: mitochondrial import inner membrane translocase subunit Tim9 isoform X5 [Calidris pugnax]